MTARRCGGYGAGGGVPRLRAWRAWRSERTNEADGLLSHLMVQGRVLRCSLADCSYRSRDRAHAHVAPSAPNLGWVGADRASRRNNAGRTADRPPKTSPPSATVPPLTMLGHAPTWITFRALFVLLRPPKSWASVSDIRGGSSPATARGAAALEEGGLALMASLMPLLAQLLPVRPEPRPAAAGLHARRRQHRDRARRCDRGARRLRDAAVVVPDVDATALSSERAMPVVQLVDRLVVVDRQDCLL